MPRASLTKSRSLLACLAAYLASGAAALLVGALCRSGSPVWAAAFADAAATIVIFAFSLALDNSSVYDPYWSVAPLGVAAYWLARSGAEGQRARQGVVLALLLLWGIRLTANWLRRWRGLADEDWRYADYRRLGWMYWPVSLLGFHLFPTLIVFLGCLSLMPALSIGARAMGLLDATAAAVTLSAIAVEAVADRQLRRFAAGPRAPGQILDTGLWALSRHPNYFGEILFWWGMYLFGVAADPSWWWTFLGPLSITALFVGISVPMMDRRMRARHPGYERCMRACSALIPLPRPGRRARQARRG